MKPSDWLAVAGVVVSLALGGVAGWTQLAARISSMEEHQRSKETVISVMREIMIKTTQDVHELKGLHQAHKHSDGVGRDKAVMAETYLKDSKM